MTAVTEPPEGIDGDAPVLFAEGHDDDRDLLEETREQRSPGDAGLRGQAIPASQSVGAPIAGACSSARRASGAS